MSNHCSKVLSHNKNCYIQVKPVSKVNKSGYLMVGVECYGGGIWHTWFDRDLTLGGRVLVKVGMTHLHKNKFICQTGNIGF